MDAGQIKSLYTGGGIKKMSTLQSLEEMVYSTLVNTINIEWETEQKFKKIYGCKCGFWNSYFQIQVPWSVQLSGICFCSLIYNHTVVQHPQ